MDATDLYLAGISAFAVWVPSLIYPPVHTILQNGKTYNILLIASILWFVSISLLSFFNRPVFNSFDEKFHFGMVLVSLSPLLFLLCYRYFNASIQKKKNRPIYFFRKHSNDIESKASSLREVFYQLLLIFIPLILFGISDMLFPYFKNIATWAP